MSSVKAYVQGSLPAGRPPILPSRPRWMDSGACNGTDDPVFFAANDEPERAREAAAQYCNSCPVRVTCLTYALSTKSPGVWAGTTLDQRKALTRSRTRVKCPLCQCEELITVNEHDMCTACGMSWRTERRPAELERDTTDGNDDR